MDNGNEPATKQDIAMLRSELKEDIATLRKEDIAMVRSEMQHIYDLLVERISDSETRLLQAFYGFADAVTKRMTQSDANVALVITRMSSFETRLLEVEKRLNIPPVV